MSRIEGGIVMKNKIMNLSDKRRIIIILIILLLLFLLIGLSFIIYGHKEVKEIYRGTSVYNAKMEENQVLNCTDVSSKECMSTIHYYRTYETTKDYPKLEELFQKFNEDTKQREIEDQKVETKDDPLCVDVKDKYKYRYTTSNYLDYYELDTTDIISVTMEITRKDYCTGEDTIIDEVYNYSKKDDILITDEEDMLKRFNYSKEELNDIIVKYSKKALKEDVDVSKIAHYRLSKTFTGILIIEYQLEGSDEWHLCKYDI